MEQLPTVGEGIIPGESEDWCGFPLHRLEEEVMTIAVVIDLPHLAEEKQIMRQIVIDELRRGEKEKAEEFLRRRADPGPMAGIYWLEVPSELWGEGQQGHAGCAPFYFAIEVGEAAVSFELLVRTQATLHCSCIGYATAPQRDYLLGFIDRMLAEQGIRA
ncbi:MAG: hypothetical protein P8Y63_03905 [Deltaproteobacteria bacterium]